jgi:hypothetical protein
VPHHHRRLDRERLRDDGVDPVPRQCAGGTQAWFEGPARIFDRSILCGKKSDAGCMPRSSTYSTSGARQERHTARCEVTIGFHHIDKLDGKRDACSAGRSAGHAGLQPEPGRRRAGYFSRTFDAEVARDAGLRPEAFV